MSYQRIAGDEKEDHVPSLPVDTIVIQIPSRKPFTVTFFEGQTVGELKNIIETHCRIPSSLQRLAFNGIVLRDEAVTLHHVGIVADQRIHCFPRPSRSIAVPLATSATPTTLDGSGNNNGITPVVMGVVQTIDTTTTQNQQLNGGNTDDARSEDLRQRGFAYHVYIQWAFRVRLFALMMLFFYGFGLVSNIAYWLGDKDMPDDREMVPGEAPHELTGPIYFLDFVSNMLGITSAMLGLRAVRESSFVVARKYLRITVALVLVSAIQLCMEVYAFSDRYQKHSAPAAGGSNTSGTGASSKKMDDLAFTVALNLLVRGMFWTLILNTAKKYVQALVLVQIADASRHQVPDIEQPVAHATPVAAETTTV